MIDDLAVCALNMDGQHLSVGEIASALKTGKEAGLSTFDEAVGLLFGLAYVVGKRCVANGPDEVDA